VQYLLNFRHLGVTFCTRVFVPCNQALFAIFGSNAPIIHIGISDIGISALNVGIGIFVGVIIGIVL
jgi:hypothetical protein